MTPWSQTTPAQRPVRHRPRASLATVTAGWAFGLLLASILVAWFIFSEQLWQSLQSAQGDRVENIAQTVATLPAVRHALASQTPPAAQSPLQTTVESLRRRLNVDFIVVMNTRAIRLTHPTPSRIGRHFRGADEEAALAGAHYVSIARGTLGRSVRGFAPVFADGAGSGDIIGAVSVGVTLSALAPLRARSDIGLLLWLAAIALLGGAGTLLLAGRIKRDLMHMEPVDIAALVREHRATLAAMHEGLIVIDTDARIRLINPAAHQLLAEAGAPPLAPGMRLPDPIMDPAGYSRDAIDQPLLIGGHRFRGTVRAAGSADTPSGCVISFRDTAELQRLGEELTGARRYAQALRAAQHDTRNRLQVILGLAETGDIAEQKRYLQSLIALDIEADTALAEQIREPTIGGFLIGKQSQARELGITLDIRAESPIPAGEYTAGLHALISVLGNLIDNAFDAVADVEDARVVVSLALDAGMLSLAVQDNGHGMDEDMQAAARRAGVTTRGETRGLGLYLTERQLADVGGRLLLYSTPGAGTLAEVELPYVAAGGIA